MTLEELIDEAINEERLKNDSNDKILIKENLNHFVI